MKLYDLTKVILINLPNTRNNDKELIWRVWSELGYVLQDTISYSAFLNKRCPIPETIRRTRQKIQELYPELQAVKKVYEARQKIAESKGTFIFREKAEVLTATGLELNKSLPRLTWDEMRKKVEDLRNKANLEKHLK